MNPKLNHASLRSLLEDNRWQQIVSITDEMSEADTLHPGFWFFRAMALIELKQTKAAVDAADKGLRLNAQSNWGNRVLFDAMLADGAVDEAFRRYKRFILESNDVEPAKAWYVERAAELDLFEIAQEMNDLREVIKSLPDKPQYALGVQCFCKADTLEAVLASLVQLAGSENYGLVILQDTPDDDVGSEKYAVGCEGVRDVIARWHRQLAARFFSIEFLQNRRNLGTAPSCRRLLDHITERFDGFLFIEDDCVLAPSALEWAGYHLENTVTPNGPWFVTCESSYFDQENRSLDEKVKARLVALSSLRSLKDGYILNDFVNSTCFGTRSSIWARCASPRSFTRGPESLSRFTNLHGIKTVAPVVPQAADIGMMHELGYSAGRVGIDNVREKKRVYTLAKGHFDSQFCREVTSDRDLIYRATCEFDMSAIEEVEKRYSVLNLVSERSETDEP